MRFTTVGALLACCLSCCSERRPAGGAEGGSSFSLTIPESFTLADPIPQDDEWLKTFREGNGYESTWETWVWRLTNIEVAPGIQVYARDRDERQFLVTGCDEFQLLSVDFRISEIGETGFYSGEHNVKLTPSKNYIVCLAANPHAFLHGLPIDDKVKRNGDWIVSFEDDTVNWHKAEQTTEAD
ncbi:hypothetical protein ACFQY0_21035 [Haloferula chungangensis]|uniref:Uncharacterized protein n=2 Tax=Haloferula chungangensis TaxID=1048331 RepID=A0ABW2LDC5_9BACT